MFSPQIPGVGDTHTVNPGSANWNENKKVYEQYSGASMRMIIEMEERPRIHLSLPGLNREYTNSTGKNAWKEWKTCQYMILDY